MSADEKRIREFAYQIWESEGCPDGQAERHWAMARQLAVGAALGFPDLVGELSYAFFVGAHGVSSWARR